LQVPDFNPATAEMATPQYLIPDDDIHPDDPDDEWVQQSKRRGVRLPAITAAMLGLAVLAAGFWGGAALEKHHASSSASSSSAISSLINRFRSAGGLSGAGAGAGAGAGGAGGGATAGIVTAVEGNILYVTNASGNLVKVQVGPSATVTRTAKSSLGGLQTGDTVIVQGTSGPSGTVTATSVRATGAGVSSAGGLGGGFFGRGASQSSSSTGG
jgi:hypothetical protein